MPKAKMYIHIVSQFAIKPVYTILNSSHVVMHKRGEYSFNAILDKIMCDVM
jgi:hypothetical protein